MESREWLGQMIQNYICEHQESARLNILGGWGSHLHFVNGNSTTKNRMLSIE